MAIRPEAKSLIVNADDFGIHPAVNRAIILAHQEGVVTSTTILAGGAAFLAGIEALQQCPQLGLGVHLCLVDQRSVLNAERIPSLVDAQGRFCSSYESFIRRFILRQIKLKDIEAELEAQISRLRDLGLNISHLDSHQHLHLLPGITKIVIRLGKKFGIRAVRLPSEMPLPGSKPPSLLRRLQGGLMDTLAEKARRRLRAEKFVSPDQFFGFARGGHFRLEDWSRLIPWLPAGVTEVMVHPGADSDALRSQFGWGYHWDEELQALLHPQLRLLIQRHKIQLINYGDLA